MKRSEAYIEEISKKFRMSPATAKAVYEAINKYDSDMFCSQMGDYDHPEERAAAEIIAAEQSQMVSVLKLMAENVGKGSSVETAFQENIAAKRGKGMVATEEGIQTVIAAVHEAYPDYKSNKLFEEMNMAIQKYNENVTRQRKAYRRAVEDYEYYTEKWPNSSVITSQGYKIKEYEHLSDGSGLKVDVGKLDSLY